MVVGCGGGNTGSDTPPAAKSRDVPYFQKPFAGDFPLANFFDHNVPKEFADTNGTFVTYWGEASPTAVSGMIDGHEGYDFLMAVGTPVVSVASGQVTLVTDSVTPFFCPPLNRNVNVQKTVSIEHTLPDGRKVWSSYTHMDRIDVNLGASVASGQQIGVSGNTGCSTSPHLHFEVYLVAPQKLIAIDPYGWSGAGADPWEQNPEGAASIQLWLPGQAPRLERRYAFDLNSVGAFAPAFLTSVAFEGVHDDTQPNNEYVDLTLDSRFAASAPLDGYSLRFAKAGISFAIPTGITLTAQNPTLRVYVGSGTNAGYLIYMGRPSGILSNLQDDCVRVAYPGGTEARFNMGACP